jgi:hypothetical protein
VCECALDLSAEAKRRRRAFAALKPPLRRRKREGGRRGPNPRHPSLKFKKVGKALWSVRVGLRALAREVDDAVRRLWIGPHNEYDAMLSRKRKEPRTPARED